MEQQKAKIAKKDLIRKKTGYPGMEIHKSGEVEYLSLIHISEPTRQSLI